MVPQLAGLWGVTEIMCGLLHTLPMGSTSSPDLVMPPFESGMLRLARQLAHLLRGTLPSCDLLLTLPMGGILSRDLVTTPFESGMPTLVVRLETP